MKRLTAIALVLIFLITAVPVTAAGVGVTVFINGVEVVAPEGEVTAFISVNGQTVIGARTFIDALKRQGIQGADKIVVGYCEPNHSSMWGRQLGAEELKKYARLPNGELRTFFDGIEGYLVDSNGLIGVPVMEYNRTYFPLRALLNWVGVYDITYDGTKKEVRVTIPKGTKLATKPENVAAAEGVASAEDPAPTTKSEYALANLKYNETLGSVKGYINGQEREPYCNFKYGAYTMAYNGCGVIGVHNALIILGKGKELRDVIYYHETHGAVLNGVFGTNPIESADYFASNNCSVTVSYEVAKFDSIAADSKVSVLTFWNTGSIFDGAHTVALTKNSDGSIDVYNYYNNSTTTERFNSIAAMVVNNGHVPIVLLGINNK